MDRVYGKGILAGLGLIVCLLIVSAVLESWNIRRLDEDVQSVVHTHEVREALEDVLSLVTDAERSQRGFLITGEARYLEPYQTSLAAVAGRVARLRALTANNPGQQARIPLLERAIAREADELARTVELRKTDFEAARLVVLTDEGVAAMRAVEAVIREMAEDERALLRERTRTSDRSYAVAIVSGFAGDVLAVFALAAFAWLLRRHLDERARAARKVLEEREWFRTTLGSIGDGVITTDVEGRVSFANPVAQALTGWTLSEAMGIPLERVFRIVNERTRATVANPARRALEDGVVVGLANHTTLIRKDGVEEPIDDSAAPIRDEEGRVLGVVLVFRSVSERRRSERALQRAQERLELAQEGGRVGAFEWDLVTNEVYWSAGLEALYGLAPGEFEGTYDGWRKRLDPADRERLESERARAVEERREFRAEFRVTWPDGSVHWLADRAKVICDEAGKPIRMIGVKVDMDERKRLEDRLRAAADEAQRARAEADAANRAKDEFLAVVSHELRTPLTAMLGWARLLREDRVEPGARSRALATIERSATKQAMLVNDLLDVSRIIAGKLRIDVHPIESVRPLLDEALQTIRPATEARGIRVDIDCDPALGPVAGDPERLVQVFWNLLSNAVKFSEKGGRVEVRGARVDSAAEVLIRDDGVGIAPDFLPQLFRRFHQAETSDRRTQGGLGLGLAIVRHIVGLHGGTVSAESAGKGRGATFRVRLPLARPQPAEGSPAGQGPARRPDGTRAAAALPSLEGIRALVLEDDPATQALVSAILEERGATALVAGSVADALATLERELPDAILADIGLPGADGYEFIRRVRAKPPGEGGLIPAAALTAFATPEDRQRALEAGFGLHIPKPVDPAGLVVIVARLAGRLAGA